LLFVAEFPHLQIPLSIFVILGTNLPSHSSRNDSDTPYAAMHWRGKEKRSTRIRIAAGCLTKRELIAVGLVTYLPSTDEPNYRVILVP
jgi:hypothetical protein